MSFFDQTNNIGSFNTKHGDGFVIHFVHVATRDTAHFKAFLTSWEDQIKQNWKSYETVGRMDPIMIYARTGRQISFSIDIPSSNEEEALLNMMQIERLMRMCYPTFSSSADKKSSMTAFVSEETASKNKKDLVNKKAKEDYEIANPGKTFELDESGDLVDSDDEKQTFLKNASEEVEASQNVENYAQQVATEQITKPIKAVNETLTFISRITANMISPPLMRIKFANWISDTNIDQNYSSNSDNSVSGPGGEKGSGLYGVIENVKFLPDLSSDGGGFYACEAYGESGKSYLIPKLLKLDIMFTVLHASDLGYTAGGGTAQRTPGFPYNAEKIYDSYIKRKTGAVSSIIQSSDSLSPNDSASSSDGSFTITDPATGKVIKRVVTDVLRGDLMLEQALQNQSEAAKQAASRTDKIIKDAFDKRELDQKVGAFAKSIKDRQLDEAINESLKNTPPVQQQITRREGSTSPIDITYVGVTKQGELISQNPPPSPATPSPAPSIPTAPPSTRIGPKSTITTISGEGPEGTFTSTTTVTTGPQGTLTSTKTVTKTPYGESVSYENRLVETE